MKEIEKTNIFEYKDPVLDVYESYLLYTPLYSNCNSYEDVEFKVLHHMFVVIGNGYKWVNSEEGLIMIPYSEETDYTQENYYDTLKNRFEELLNFVINKKKKNKPIYYINLKDNIYEDFKIKKDPLHDKFILGLDDLNELSDSLKERCNDFLSLTFKEYSKKYKCGGFLHINDIIKKMYYSDNEEVFLYPPSEGYVLASLNEEEYKNIAPGFKKIILKHLESIKDSYYKESENDIIKNTIKKLKNNE